MKRLHLLALLVLFIFTLSSCCQTFESEGSLIVTLVTDTSGIGDKGFNEIAWKGLMKARDELGIVIKKIESSDPANYIKNLATAARYGDLTIANGFLILDAMKEVAVLYPQYDFVFIDGVIDSENVASYTFRSQEVGFLAGVLAAGMSNTHRTGILKGMNIPPVETFEFGFKAGARCADLTWGTETDVKSLTAGDFNDPQKGFSITSQFINDERDIVFQLAGATALGAINAIKGSKRPAYLIGVDLDQDDEIPGKVLTSAMKRIDVVVYQAIKAKLENKFQGGHFSVGIKEGALSLTDMRHTKSLIPDEIHLAIERAQELIIGQKVKLPVNDEQLAKFQAVELGEEK
jgi:basic membrane protein A